jgi:hypothetical protein
MDSTAQETPTTPQPSIQSTSPIQPPQQPSSKSKLFIIVVVIVLLLLVAGTIFGYFLGSKSSPLGENNKVVQISPTNSQLLSPTPSHSVYNDWKTYTGTLFSVMYPSHVEGYQGEWIAEQVNNEFSSGVFFGPQSLMEDGPWVIFTYDKRNKNTKKSIEEYISEQGNQFTDRKETRKQRSVNGIPATYVTVTTPRYSNWISHNVYFEKNGLIFVIINGAVEIPEFEDFYKSFTFTN